MENLTKDLEKILDEIFSTISSSALRFHSGSGCFGFSKDFKVVTKRFQFFTFFDQKKADNVTVDKEKFSILEKLLKNLLLKEQLFSVEEPKIYFKFTSSQVDLDIRKIGKYYLCLDVNDISNYGSLRITDSENYAKYWIKNLENNYENNLQIIKKKLEETKKTVYLERNKVSMYQSLVKKIKENKIKYELY